MGRSKEKGWVKSFIITTFVALYLIVSIISTIHVIDFFRLSNPDWLAISLAVGFEIGAAASLASLIALEKMNRFIVWVLFFTLTGMQAMGNTYYAYTHLKDFTQWSELFGLIEEDLIYQKRILSIISGAILPLVALGFIKSLVDYIRPEDVPGVTVPVPSGPDELIPIDLTLDLSQDLTSEDGSSVQEEKTQDQFQDPPEVENKTSMPDQDQNQNDHPGISQGDSFVVGERRKSIWHRIFNNEDSPTKIR